MTSLDAQQLLDAAECIASEEEVQAVLDRLAGEIALGLRDTFPLVLAVMGLSLMTSAGVVYWRKGSAIGPPSLYTLQVLLTQSACMVVAWVYMQEARAHQRDAAELHLTLQPSHKAAAFNVAHMMVEDIEAIHAIVRERGLRIVKGLRDKDYGLRAFVFEDPDGNRIDVGEPLRA